MIQSRRELFNSRFSPAIYQHLVSTMEKQIGVPIEFRISETPVFLPSEFLTQIVRAATEINRQLLTPAYLDKSDRAIPEHFRAPHQTPHPTFIQTDFAVTRNAEGKLTPQLVELQGCASVHAFQLLLSHAFQTHYDLSGLAYAINQLSDEDYLQLLRRAIVGNHPTEEVVLMEIEPQLQKTLPDFIATEQLLGIRTIAVTDVVKHGNRLFYRDENHERPIQRIYNRVIVDELVRKNISLNFDYRDELEIEWAGHPNWFFRLSKFSLPFLNHPAVPRSWFLNQLDKYPDDLENFVLKPLFSFAGSGVKVDISSAELDQIPESDRGNFLLQEKIHYEPIIETPTDPAKVEIRIMFIWPDDDPVPTPTLLLGRMSKGALMGVDFNKNKTWVGASACFFEV